MRSTTIRLFCATLGLGAIAACSRILISEPRANPNGTSADSVSRLLVGSWKLEQGCGGIAYHCHPASALNEPDRYVFSANGRVKAYRGLQLLFETNYTITPGGTGENDEHRALLLIGAGPLVDPRPLRVTFRSADALLLDEGCCDRYEFEYSRD